MSKYVQSLKPSFTTDAEFRAFITMVRAGLTSAGLVQTSDTGQINPTTVTKPTTVNTVAGYEIWRSNDGNGTTKFNWYMKIEYASGNGTSGNNASFYITIGWSTDGAGAINSLYNFARTQLTQSSSVNATANFNYWGGDGTYLTMLINVNDQYHIFLAVERTRDATGAELGDEIFVQYSHNGNTLATTGQVVTKTVLPPNSQLSVVAAPNSTNTPFGGKTAICLVFPQKGALLNPSLNFIGGTSAIFTPVNTEHTVNIYGADHNYLYCNTYPKPDPTFLGLMRYE